MDKFIVITQGTLGVLMMIAVVLLAVGIILSNAAMVIMGLVLGFVCAPIIYAVMVVIGMIMFKKAEEA